jgi:hypothetical protein
MIEGQQHGDDIEAEKLFMRAIQLAAPSGMTTTTHVQGDP